jgi:hypothetical protein
MDMPMPNPWLMGVITLGAGVVLWWLTPAMARQDEEAGRSVGRERFPVTGYLSAAIMIGLGIVILVVTAARTF